MTKFSVIVLLLIIMGIKINAESLLEQETVLFSYPLENHSKFKAFIRALQEKYSKEDVSEVIGFSMPVMEEYLNAETHHVFATHLFEFGGTSSQRIVEVLAHPESISAMPSVKMGKEWERLFCQTVRNQRLVTPALKHPHIINEYLHFLLDNRSCCQKYLERLIGSYSVDTRKIDQLSTEDLYHAYECIRDYYRNPRNEMLLSDLLEAEVEKLEAAAAADKENHSSWFSRLHLPRLPWSWSSNPKPYEALKRQ
jgi:hypothetical protein